MAFSDQPRQKRHFSQHLLPTNLPRLPPPRLSLGIEALSVDVEQLGFATIPGHSGLWGQVIPHDT